MFVLSLTDNAPLQKMNLYKHRLLLFFHFFHRISFSKIAFLIIIDLILRL